MEHEPPGPYGGKIDIVMNKSFLRRGWISLILVVIATNNGCWGRKFFHAPGASIETSAKVDSLIEMNMVLQRRVYALEQAISDQKDYSRGVNAQSKLDVEELKDQLNALLQAIDETGQGSVWEGRPATVRDERSAERQQPAVPDSSEAGDAGEDPSDSLADSLTAGKAVSVPGPDVMCRQLYLDFSRMEYQLAIEESEDFFAEYPDHPLGEEVRFIRGECYMEMEKYFDALKEFSSVLQGYPRGKKVPSSLLRMAEAYHSIGDDDLAAGVVRRLVREYPGSEEASVAREQFGDMLDQ